MKKGFNVLLFLLLCAAAGPAQTSPSPPAAADAPANVTVVKFNWERIQRPTEWDAPVNSAASQTVEDGRASTIPQEPSGSRAPAPLGGSSSTASRGRTPTTGRGAAMSGDGNRPSDTPQPALERGAADYVYQLRITNGGERRVESVDWEYVFLDPGTKKELGRHRFLSPRRAKPGETFTLTAPSLSPPARVVSAVAIDKKRKPFDERVVVRCVAYADGTFARREGAAEADCDALREATARAQRRRKQ